MAMRFGKSELRGRIPLKIEFDEHRGLVTNHAPIVARFNHDHLRRREVAGAAVLEGHVNFALGQKADMGVRAELGADVGLDVARPVEADWIDRALHPSVARANHVELNTAELLVLGSGNGCEE